MPLSFSLIIKWLLKLIFFIATLAGVGFLSAYITMKILIGGGEITVPNLIGTNVKTALQIVSQYDLNLSISETKRYDDKIKPDSIISQNPPPGSRIKKGRKVEVILSMGTEKIDLPDLKEESEREAIIMIQQLNLRVGFINSISNIRYPDGVISQYPRAGTKIARGMPIDLLINKIPEPRFIMPDIIGKNLEATTYFFNKYNIRIGGIKIEEYPEIAPKTIIKQLPQIGYPLKPSDIISITISK